MCLPCRSLPAAVSLLNLLVVHCALQAVINEDTSGDAAVLRAENKRLKSELVLARQLIQHSTAHANGQTAAELEEQQAQLQQALTMLAELGNRNSELEDALEYSKRCGYLHHMQVAFCSDTVIKL